MLSSSVDADFVLVLPFHHGDLEPYCACKCFNEEGEWVPTMKRKGERSMLPMLAVGWASALRGEEAGRFREAAGVSIVAAVGPRSQ